MSVIPPLTVDIGSGFLTGAARIDSPNQDQRPPGAALDLIVIHGISLPPGEYGGAWVEALFTNTLPPERHPYFRSIDGLRVSAHLYIRRDGQIVQFVPFHARAWHAGASVWQHRLACNDYSVGIELEGCDEEPYESAQYGALLAVIDALERAYSSLRGAPIVGHSDIAPGRKTDPGPHFDWERLRLRRLGLATGRHAT
jgi:N-acetyl-anhydromuramoyl-L-alanine amidase